MLNFVLNGSLVYGTIEVDGVTRLKTYKELTDAEKLQDDCDIAKDIWDRVKLLIKGTELSQEELECKLYDDFDRFTSVKGDDPVASLNKAMSFLTALITSRFPTTNNQLRTYSNTRNQATIQDGRVIVQQVQGRQGQSFAGMGSKRGRAYTKEVHSTKEAKEISMVQRENTDSLSTRSCSGTDHLDAFNSDCDEAPGAKAFLMVNLSSYDSAVIFENVNESLTAELERYKERVRMFEERKKVDLNDREKYIKSQMNDTILNKNAKFASFQKEIDSLKFSLSENVKDNESLMTTINVLKNQSKEKEDKYIKKEIDFEKQIKELENIVFKVCQSAQTMHILTKPQVFYDDNHKQALGYQNPFYLKKDQRIMPTLYDCVVISRKHDVISLVDSEETLTLAEDSRSKMLEKQNDPVSKEKKVNISPINYSELNKLSKNFQKYFVPQKELSTEQAFWLPISNPISKQLVPPTPVKIEVPNELPKDFDNGPHDELNEVKTVFNQKEAAVEQCSVDKKCFEIQKKERLLKNDRLLELIISQDLVHTAVNSLEFIHECESMRKR
ncbi:hypothetical protein Tco_0587458 [Tanacetum coccineum]